MTVLGGVAVSYERGTPVGRPSRLLVSPNRSKPHGGVRAFHQKTTCLTQLTLGPCVVQIWSRNTPESGINETLVLRQAGGTPCTLYPVPGILNPKLDTLHP
jgi:hypothetical protein